MRNIFLALVLLWPCAAFAATKPVEIASVIHAEKPYGEGTMTRLWIKAYDASLWTDAPTWSMDVPFALTIVYHIDFDADELVDRTLEEMQHSTTLSKETMAHYKEILIKIFPAVDDKDEITALHIPHKGVKFFYNGKPIGAVEDPEFTERFFGIWLSPSTTEPALRKALLKQ